MGLQKYSCEKAIGRAGVHLAPVIFERSAKARLAQDRSPFPHQIGTDSSNQADQWGMKGEQRRSFSNLREDTLLERSQFGEKIQHLPGGRITARKESRSSYPTGTQRFEVSRYHLGW